MKENQVAHLREALGPKGYEIVGRGRLAEGKSEGVYIIYNAKRFDCTASDTFQLSETPEVCGSSSWNSAYPRTCAWVQLKDRESGKEFRLYNTHLDHVSELARKKGMELTVKAHIAEVGWKTYKGIDGSENSGTGTSEHDPIIGTVGKSLGLQAIEIDVTKNPKKLKVSYRVHVGGFGWGPWIPAGYTAGTTGIGRSIEAIQIKAV